MKPLSKPELKRITKTYEINYESVNPRRRRKIGTKMSRIFKIEKLELFSILEDPLRHQSLFSQFKLIQPINTDSFLPVIGENEIISLEWVDEGGSKIALAKTTINKPDNITKEIITNPWDTLGGMVVQDRKKGVITWDFRAVEKNNCELICESDFEVSQKTVFIRPLIDTIWVDFFERLLIETGEIQQSDKIIK